MASFDEITEIINKIFYYEKNLRLFAAFKELEKLKDIKNQNNYENLKERIENELERNLIFFSRLVKRVEELNQIIQDTSDSLDDWILGSELFGIKTFYRIEDDGLLSLRMEGIQEIPIFEQLAVLYEVDLFNQWMPFCSQSELLKQIC